LNKEKDIKIMINIEHYMTDGANWQAQCVLAYLRSIGNSWVENFTWNKEKHRAEGELRVGRCENCREQGYIFTLTYGAKQLVHFWVYEHRNSDNLIVLISEGFNLNTPSVDFMWKDKGENASKYDYDKEFPYGDIVRCGRWIIDDMLSWIDKLAEENKVEEEK
jgi:hypothetical protein